MTDSSPTTTAVRELCARHELTARQLAALAHVSVSTAAHWLDGTRSMPRTAWVLVRALMLPTVRATLYRHRLIAWREIPPRLRPPVVR